ncbi:hypothetical protein BEWA_024570 [Theileria equi strain WA]|uniref:Uncharacterized protein n=1 Tax=Theileria equi strain WA TaxID=1537102 RepID=L0AWH4_THEEQ|nr:hypothetical protein BEWA_024570 [Theileria equi strain WA]AFZ79608.1 hypothetical protein BEWA_024570 [Theileria equi strain WA]|eukprot:XP_004829274.1 hypothetical protein BEWA_024570 [Theileria equi strain WA]
MVILPLMSQVKRNPLTLTSGGVNKQFTVKAVLGDDGGTPLILHPCIDGPVNEIAVYYEKDRTNLICAISNGSHYYYWKGDDRCRYRYRYHGYKNDSVGSKNAHLMVVKATPEV